MNKDLIIKSVERNGFVANYGYDECCFDSPRTWDNLGVIFSNHRKYNPDNHKIEELSHIIEDKNGELCLSKLNKDYIWLAINAYIHSGIALTAYEYNEPHHFDRWDSGLFGVILVSKDRVREVYKCKRITKAVREKVLSCLEGEVETLSQWYNGEVYRWEVLDEDGDVFDMVCDYYDEDFCEEEMMDALERACIEKEEEELEKKLMAIAV